MSDPTAPNPKSGVLKFGGDEITMSPTPLNVVYFDNAPSLSYMNGIVGITLVVTGNVPLSDKGVANVASVVAHLKCNIPAAISLRDSLDAAILLAQPTSNPQGQTN